MTEREIKHRIRAFEKLFIEHPRILQAERAIIDLELRQQNDCEPQIEFLCSETTSANTYSFSKENASSEEEENQLTQHGVLVVGDAGAGKSRLKDQIKDRPEFKPNLTGPYGDVIPLLSFDMPDKPTPKSFLAELCNKVGVAMCARPTRNELASKLRRQLKQIGTRLIMIDEAHTLTEGRKDEAVLEAARCLKFLLNTCGVPIVLLGEKPLSRLMVSKALTRRIDCHISIEPYSWSYEDERYEFLNCLDQLDEALRFDSRCRFAENDDLSSRLYFISGGHIGLVAKYLTKALKLALRTGEAGIDAQLLSRVYREMNPIVRSVHPDPDFLELSLADPDNPFLVDRDVFKQMWAEGFGGSGLPNQLAIEDTSEVIKRKRQPKLPKNTFANG